MGRIRTIKPGFFTDADLAELPPLTRILYEGLWCQMDRAGLMEDDPREIKVQVLPYDDCDVDSMLWDLAEAGFIVRYEVDGERFITCPAFAKHQRPNVREAPSSIPPPTAPTAQVLSRARTCMHVPRANPDVHAALTRDNPARGEGKGREGEGKETATQSGGAVARPAASPEAPKKPTTAAQEFATWAEGERRKRVPPTDPPDAPTKPGWIEISRLLRAHGVLLAQEAWRLWAADTYAQQAGFPIALFAAQWERWVRAAQRAPASPDAPPRADKARLGPGGGVPVGVPRG